jgi:hypothetical protein
VREKALELHGKATAGPWSHVIDKSWNPAHRLIRSSTQVVIRDETMDRHWKIYEDPINYDLIALYRGVCPVFAALLLVLVNNHHDPRCRCEQCDALRAAAADFRRRGAAG